MNKRTVTFLAFVGMAIGGYVPILLGWDKTGLDGPSLLGGLVGGLAAIWLAVKISKNLNL